MWGANKISRTHAAWGVGYNIWGKISDPYHTGILMFLEFHKG